MSSAPEGYGQEKKDFDLIVTIVPQGGAGSVVQASRAAGAEGATILHGRGTGIHERKQILGMWIEPEKEIVFILVPSEISERVLDAIVEATDLDKPGRGIAFVLSTKRVAGISHLDLD